MFYHLPLKHWLRALFSQPELAPYLHLVQGSPPEGSVKLSNGYQQKALANPVINTEQRNQALIGTADGVPLFGIEKSKRNGTPFMLRSANAPDAVSLKLFNCHLHGFLPGEYFSTNPIYPKKKMPVRTIHSPKNSCGVMHILADDLLSAYKDGFDVTDQSLPCGDPTRLFRCRAVLLYWSITTYLTCVFVVGVH